MSFPAERRNGPEPSEPCGTLAAYRRHYRRGEPPCDACRIARNREKAEKAGMMSAAAVPDTTTKARRMAGVTWPTSTRNPKAATIGTDAV